MRRGSLASRLFLGQLAFILLVSGGLGLELYAEAEDNAYNATADRMLAVAGTAAASSVVREAVEPPVSGAGLQEYAKGVMERVGVDFLTIMDTDRTRFSHPDPEQIGRPYIGTIEPALAGGTLTETYTGTLGPSVRAIVPVTGDDGAVLGLVAAGTTVDRVDLVRDAQLPELLLHTGIALVLGTAGSLLLSRYLNRATHGLGPQELLHMFTFYDSALHSVQDGLVLLDPRGDVVLYNDQAAALLGLPEGGRGPHRPEQLDLPEPLRQLLRSGRDAREEIHLTGRHVLVVNQAAALSAGPKPRRFGTVTTLRDHTDIESLTGEVANLRTLADALNAQTHEHANRIHTLVSLIELDRREDALRFATADLERSQQLNDEVLAAVAEPAVTALLMGKAAQARERGLELDIRADDGRGGPWTGDGIDPVELVTIIGNLLDNAFDAAAARVELHLSSDGRGPVIEARDDGPGVAPDVLTRIFDRGFSTKAPRPGTGAGRGVGLALVQQAVTRLDGSIEVLPGAGARFRVLLPAAVPEGAQ
ncbi:Sensor histidine kinase DcuS [Arthrobacter saudimassiliensis]|uniref:histidine kinase n=1 Tax=Arthrobacter saudimassiliensis TaxID=1461584 RepID=A0A078MQR4_9MICC|nr:Sensor histidine kinase DcuS [Arthrobacter saudimassiliensis]